jgi:hypothetical protein
MNVSPWVKKFPYSDHPGSDVAALIMVEQINPPINYAIECRDILAIHKAIGYVPGDPALGSDISSGDMLLIGDT